jgi:very-short-patch-repair endonuclease
MEKDEIFDFLKKRCNFYCQEKQFIKKFPDIYGEICDIGFPDDFTLQQKIYHYFMNDYELHIGVCPVCGRRCKFKNINFGYWSHCSSRCATTDTAVMEKMFSTNMERYGVDHVFKSDAVKNKRRETCVRKYGVRHYSQTEECQKKRRETCLERYGVEHYSQTDECQDKKRKTCLKKYGVGCVCQTNEFKNKKKKTCLKKYGTDDFTKTECFRDIMKQKHNEIQKKQYITKRRNNSFNTSKIEEQFEKYLTSNGIEHVRQHKDDNYPYFCDFYIPKYELYVEIQGCWTHGGHPFDRENVDDLEKLMLWKSKDTRFYDSAVETWVVRDVAKREIAAKNRLNYLEIFSIDITEVVKTFENFYKNRVS